MNPVDSLRSIGELTALHVDAVAELVKAERTVEYLTGRVAELEAAITEKETMQ